MKDDDWTLAPKWRDCGRLEEERGLTERQEDDGKDEAVYLFNE